jgi:hypothetical protein
VALRDWRWTRVAALCVLYWVTLGAVFLASTMFSLWSDRNRFAQAHGNTDVLVSYSVHVNVVGTLALLLLPPLVLTAIWRRLRRPG